MVSDEMNVRLEVVAWLQKVMPGTYTEFKGPTASDMAAALAAQQGTRWASIFQILYKDDLWKYFVNILQDIVDRSDAPQITNIGDVFVVERSVPLIITNISERMVSQAAQFPEVVLSFVLLKCRRAIRPNAESSILSLLLSSSIADLRISTWMNNDNNLLKEVNESITRLTGTEKEMKRSATEFSKQVDGASQVVLELSEKSDALLKSLGESDEQRRVAWEEEKPKIIAGLKREALETARIESSIELWQTKARSHNSVFWIGAGLFAIALIAAATGTILFGVPFVRTVADNFAGNRQYFGIALLLIPTLATAWVIRFIARITLQNLALAQDARQRHTQILTYLRMLGDSNQSMSKDERILALSAIFRPLSGQGTDDVSPPTVADLVREALDHGMKSK